MQNQLNIFEEINHSPDVGKMVSEFYLNGMGEPLPWEKEEYEKHLASKELIEKG